MMEAKKVPHYQRIARQLKSAIENGELAPGSRLPASRVYAQELGVSRATIENARGELVAHGRSRLSARRQARDPPRRSLFKWGYRHWIFSRAGCGRG